LETRYAESVAVALLAGALIGTEREQAHATRRDFGGIRTFPLLTLLGATTSDLGISSEVRPRLGGGRNRRY